MNNTWKEYKKDIPHIKSHEAIVAITCTIIERRIELGLSEKELAKKADVPVKTIIEMERLKKYPRLDEFLKILHCLEMLMDIKE